MTRQEWTQIAAKLNANYPGQQVEPPTAAEWFGPLQGFPASEVWDAVDRVRRESRFLPSLAELLAALDANWRERSAARRELEAQKVRAARNSRGGALMPDETKQAIELLRRSTLMPGNPDRLDPAVARERIEALADQLTERQDREKAGQLT